MRHVGKLFLHTFNKTKEQRFLLNKGITEVEVIVMEGDVKSTDFKQKRHILTLISGNKRCWAAKVGGCSPRS